ncbi:MAG: lipid A biosynthesis acyltransferase, partial [Bacteroidota bacterium]
MNHFLYYVLVKPLSFLPLALLYRLSDLLAIVLYYLVPYRKKVVLQNLRKAFPERSEEAIRQLARQFYRHFCDVLVESIRIFSMSEAEVQRRCVVRNPEIFTPYLDPPRNVVIVAAHYGNWELAGLAVEGQIPHQVVGLYMPLSNTFWQKKISASRTRFGLKIIAKNKIKTLLQKGNEALLATVFIIDQSPSSSRQKQYWTQFLHQETGVLPGAEKYARTNNYPIFYAYHRRLRRGYYD